MLFRSDCRIETALTSLRSLWRGSGAAFGMHKRRESNTKMNNSLHVKCLLTVQQGTLQRLRGAVSHESQEEGPSKGTHRYVQVVEDSKGDHSLGM